MRFITRFGDQYDLTVRHDRGSRRVDIILEPHADALGRLLHARTVALFEADMIRSGMIPNNPWGLVRCEQIVQTALCELINEGEI